MNPVALAQAQDFAQSIIERAKADETVETFLQTAETTKVQFHASKLKDATVREARGLGIRLITSEGRVGCFATSDFSDPAGALSTARDLAALDTPYPLTLPEVYAPAEVETHPGMIHEFNPEVLVEDGTSAINQLKSALPQGLHDSELYLVTTSFELANSHGSRAGYTHTEYTGYLVTSITREDDQLEAYELFQSDNGAVDFGGPLLRLIEKVRWANTGATLAAGNYPVLFTPNGLGTFAALINALNGKPVQEGLSSLRDARDTQALSPLLTLTDDPTVPGGPMSYPFDDEGITARPTPLIKGGVVRNFLFDVRYGLQAGSGSTGNGLRCGRTTIGAGRGYANGVNPACSNLIFEPGLTPVHDLIAEMDHGLIVDSVMGVHTGNMISGDFSVNLDLALVVEKGQVIGRLKDAMLSGNTFQLLKSNLQALSAERFWAGNMYAPYFLVEGVAIATA